MAERDDEDDDRERDQQIDLPAIMTASADFPAHR
jgi:hypothetical protein